MQVLHLEACFLDSALNVESVVQRMVLDDGNRPRHGRGEGRERLGHYDESFGKHSRFPNETGRQR